MPEFALHGHFFQLPRGNPLRVGSHVLENEAAPYQNWNARVNAESYSPNSELGNFERMSFSVGTSLLDWMSTNRKSTYRSILEADRLYTEQVGAGNALGVPLNHAILPLARQRDKITAIRWGVIDFLHRFGRRPKGMWLPEMAVDLETLQVLRQEGILFTILSRSQIESADGGAGPYRVELPNSTEIGIYVRDDELSNEIAFNLSILGGAGRWARDVLASHVRSDGRLKLLAVDGESFGHHHRGEEQFLKWLLTFEAPAVGYRVTTLEYDFVHNSPQTQIGIHERTSWSCPHGVTRWVSGCDCTPAAAWKGMLRRAFEHLVARLDEAMVIEFEPTASNLWALRDDYIRVRWRQITERELMEKHGAGELRETAQHTLLQLLHTSYIVQKVFNSAVFQVGDLDRPEPRTAIAFAGQAAMLAEAATGENFSNSLKRDLADVLSAQSGRSAADILETLKAEANALSPG